MKNKLFIANTHFLQKSGRKWTWLSPDGPHKNMIDLILIDKRWKSAVRNCRTYQGADFSSDHSLVMCKVHITLKFTSKNTTKSRINAELLKDLEDKNAAFCATLKNVLVSEKETLEKSEIQGLEKRTDALYNVISQAMKENIPKVKTPNKRWITQKT